MTARGAILGLFAVATGLAVWFGRHAVLGDLDRKHWNATHPVLSPPLPVGERGHWEWTLPGRALPRGGEAQLKLVLQRHPAVPLDSYMRENMALRLRVSARQASAARRSLAFETRFPADRPEVGSSYAVSGYDSAEVDHTIGTIQVDPASDTTFSVEVETPDPGLERAQPRFMVIGTYDFATLQYGGTLVLVRDVIAAGLAILFLSVGVTAAWFGRSGPRAGLQPRVEP